MQRRKQDVSRLRGGFKLMVKFSRARHNFEKLKKLIDQTYAPLLLIPIENDPDELTDRQCLAQCGNKYLRWKRGDDESSEDFLNRAAAEAKENGAVCLLTGLCDEPITFEGRTEWPRAQQPGGILGLPDFSDEAWDALPDIGEK